MSQSIDLNHLAMALVQVQGDIKAALKSSENPFFHSKYANLESVWDVCRQPLVENGLCVIQTMESVQGEISVVTTLLHVSGQWISGSQPVVAVKRDPQSVGAAITYARRFGLSAIVGIVQADDDGESAMGRNHTPEQVEPTSTESVYRIPFGFNKGKRLDEVEVGQLRADVAYWEDLAFKQKKPLTGKAKEFVEEATTYIVEFENKDLS